MSRFALPRFTLPKMHPILIAILLCLVCLPTQAGRVLNDALVTRPFNHHIWQEVLMQRVNSQAEVDFTALRANPKRLNQYIDQLAAVSPDTQPTYFPSPDDALAYWINAHNAIALRQILDSYPIETLAFLPQFENRTRYRLGGRSMSLLQIRQKIMASLARKPLLSVAITDYTQSAPPILREAYEAKSLDNQLHQVLHLIAADHAVLHFDNSNAACAGVTVSPFLKGTFDAANTPSQAQNEDQDALGESPTLPEAQINWLEVLQQAASPEVTAALNKSCQHEIRFFPENKALRQVRRRTDAE